MDSDGIFGRWIEDEDGLPAYLYTMRSADPAAAWRPGPLPPSTLHWHQLGNERITANAYNLGMVQVFFGESGPRWLNCWEPDRRAHAGGFGWLIDGETVLVDRDDCVPRGAQWERTFGVAYFSKRLAAAGLAWERRIFAPAGDLPVLVSEVTVGNEGATARDVTLIEYWDVNPRRISNPYAGIRLRDMVNDARFSLVQQGDGALCAAVPRRIFGPHGGFPRRRTLVDPELPAVFLASLDATPDAWITRPEDLFTAEGPRLDQSPARRGERAVPPSSRRQSAVCLALRLALKIRPGESRTLRFLYGWSKGRSPREIVADAAGAADWQRTAGSWKRSLPALTGMDGQEFLGRELAWSSYYVASSSFHDAYSGCHTVPQGGNYLYDSGVNGAARDTAGVVLPLSYYRPAVARETLSFMMRYQDASGRFYYDLNGFGRRYRLPYRPSDLDLWFLWALCEYVNATRDYGFLDEVVPYYPLHAGLRESVWRHALRSLDHLIQRTGVGRHGHLRIKLSDWNDEMTWLTARDRPLDIVATIMRGESVLNTAMACHVLPLVRDIAAARGDAGTAGRMEAFLAGMRRALNEAWNGDHLLRSYSGRGVVYGDAEICLEPQVWALLAEGSLDPARERVLVRSVVSRLKQPSTLGLVISSAIGDSLTTRGGEQETGGTWFAVNSQAAIALSRFDPALAWDEVIRNTLAWHAHSYPRLWYGIWSGPDAWNGPASKRPGETWCQNAPLMVIGPQKYPVQNVHSHCETMYAVARLAGITPTADGWTIAPRIPRESYSFSCALFDLAVAPSSMEGTVRLPVTADLRLKVHVPRSWRAPRPCIDGRPAECFLADGVVSFTVHARAGDGVAWRIEPASP